MINIKIDNNKSPNFIGAWNIDNDNLCKDIINFFEQNLELQQKGTTSSGVNEKIKKTTDITINPSKLTDPKYKVFNDYFKQLNECFISYKNQYSFIKTFLHKAHIGHFNIQKYVPGDHFSHLHSERTDISNLHRIFAWMTYLNDAVSGTEFPYQERTVTPKAGRTVIWPASWTHPHKGVTPNEGLKYIATGWFYFLP